MGDSVGGVLNSQTDSPAVRLVAQDVLCDDKARCVCKVLSCCLKRALRKGTFLNPILLFMLSIYFV